MARLIVLVRTLLPVMLLAIFFGSIGHLCAIAVTVSAASGIAGIAGQSVPLVPVGILPYFLIAFAVCRGIFHYAEQYCNHFIAFKLLAVIRHRIFSKLRELCPAKLEGRDKGNLISIITSDIELLEVFYAHTISPAAIALIVSACMTVFIWQENAAAGIIALCAYITVGFVIPLVNAKLGGGDGLKFRNAFGALGSFVLDSLRGLDETIQYGCGKSTLLKLLMRFWDVQSGSVSLSNKDIRTIDTASLRAAESYVTQETALFRDTIANNIAIGKIGATREEIIDAAKKASLDEFVSSLPDGYDTEVGELGSTLSGGERQRIGLARAFLHDAPIMLLDEPTSNLDSLNEGIILKSLNEKSKRKTVVIVSHRMSTLNIAHSIFEMQKEST